MEISLLQAWYRRGKANASLNGYEDAVHDLNVAMHLEESLAGRSQIERELKLILDQYKGNNSVDQHDQNDLGTLGKMYPNIFLICFILHVSLILVNHWFHLYFVFY